MKNSDYINKNGFFIGLPTKRIKKSFAEKLAKKIADARPSEGK